MEKQLRAERDRRAAILNAEGVKQSQILTAEGEKQAAVLRADGDRQARILQAEGQAKAIRTVFEAIHTSNPDSKVLAYQYLQALPQIAAGPSNKIWVVPVELTKALEGIGGALGGLKLGGPSHTAGAPPVPADEAAEEAVRVATAAAAEAAAVAEEGPRGLPSSSGTSASSLLGEEHHPERA